MADFHARGTLSGHQLYGVTKDVKSGAAASIEVGDLVRDDDGNAGYVKKCANGDTSTLVPRCYIAVGASTDTVAADGTVQLLTGPQMVIEGLATTPANLLQAVIDTKVTLDVAAGVQKVDENDTTTGFMRILRPDVGTAGGASGFDTTVGSIKVVVNE